MRTSQKTPGTITTIGIDLGKNTFHLVGFDKRGAIVLQRKVSRSQLEHRLCNVPRCLIGMEACSGSHHIGRQLTALGHDVRLIPARYVKPFLKGHKNDYRDAEAIAEAVLRPTMSFVAIKTPEPNGSAGFASEQGRDFSAWLGLVPNQELTGDRTILGKISKRGNKYVRTLFVQAAHVDLVRRPSTAMRGLWPWIEQASKRLHRNMLAIALANKLARIAWAVLARGQAYQPRIAANAA